MNPNQQKITQYGVGPIPYHTHNGIDSPLVNYTSLSNAPISGLVTLVAGTATIKNARITTKSTIVVTSQTSRSTSEYQLGAICNTGNAVIFEGSNMSTDTVNYVIFINS